MKTLQYLFFGAMATLLMAADCSNKDSEFYNDVYVNTSGLVDIEDKISYTTGDILWINTDNFSRYVNEANQPNKLDVYKTSGGANSFTFSYLLEKRNASQEWDLVNIEENMVQRVRGKSVPFGDFLLAQATYDGELRAYEYRGGLKLNSTGQFRLSFTYNGGVSNNIVLVSDSVENNLFVNLYSLCSDTPSGYYYFEVE